MSDETTEKATINVISKEEAWHIINAQIETHQHLQSQAQGTLKFLMAIVGISVTILLSSPNIQLQPNENEISEAAAVFSTNPEAVRGTLFLWEPLVLTLSLPFWVLFFLNSLIQLVLILRSPQLHPYLNRDTNHEYVLSVEDSKMPLVRGIFGAGGESHSGWISKNRELISEEQQKLTIAITDFLAWFALGISYVIISTSIANANIPLILMINFLIVFPVILLIAQILGVPLTMIYNQSLAAGYERISLIRKSFKEYIVPYIPLKESGVPTLALLYLVLCLVSFYVLQFYVIRVGQGIWTALVG